tara:strand:- start:6 stop:575 length:570 start_codon:yes stop_codon:yes gene_type:complete
MWALVENNEVSKVFPRPKAITIGDVNYPSNIFSVWSSDDLEGIGIYEVVIDNTNYKNPEYYINTNQSFNFANDTVTASYGTATARPLDDSTNDDGVVTKGLKTLHKEVIDSQAYGLLEPNDWLVVRNQEAGTAIPSDWSTFRTNVRSTASTMKGLIDDVSDVDGLAALYVYDPETDTRPLGEWPTAPSS